MDNEELKALQDSMSENGIKSQPWEQASGIAQCSKGRFYNSAKSLYSENYTSFLRFSVNHLWMYKLLIIFQIIFIEINY